MASTGNGVSRQAVLVRPAAVGAGILLAACGGAGGRAPEAPAKSAPPQEITLVKTQSAELVERSWQETFDAGQKATGVKVTIVREPGGVPFWEKRQQEYDARNRALYADDASSIRGTELNVDLHVKYKVTPTPQINALVPAGSSVFRSKLAAIQIDYLGFVAATDALGAGHVEVAPPPKGPTGIQQARVAGNSWSILALSKAQDAAWTVLKWTHTKDGLLNTPQMKGIGWPPLIWAAESPQWLEPFKGTRVADVQKVWQTAGHNQVVLPEGDTAIQTMNAPLNRALAGEIGTRDAMRDSADKLNALFAQRPKEWEL